MPNPTTAAEWAEKCNVDYLASMRVEGKSNGHVRHGLCTYCADAYARQQVEATRERADLYYEDSMVWIGGISCPTPSGSGTFQNA